MEFGIEYSPNYKQDYFVLMKDSNKIAVSSKMHLDTEVKKTYLLFVDKTYGRKDPRREKKIYADQTLKISRPNYFGNQPQFSEINGVPTDSCWLFKSFSGKINGYSYLNEGDDPTTFSAIQLDDGPIVQVDEANLTPMVGRNEFVLALIRQKKYYQAIKQFNKDFEKAQKK